MRVSFEAVAREYSKECDLAGQLTISVFLIRLKLAAAEQEREQSNVAAMGIVDRERGWRLVEVAP